MTPTIGRIVHYRLSVFDADEINRRRSARVGPGEETIPGVPGNHVSAGEIVAMIVVKDWSETCINGQAILDGEDSLWATSVVQGDEPGQWSWPPRV